MSANGSLEHAAQRHTIHDPGVNAKLRLARIFGLFRTLGAGLGR
jgi:hypothetical protein